MFPLHKKLAFTLAEVLITLLIIGVVASIILPSIIADTQEQEYKTAWKKAYATISNAARLQLAEEGSVNVNTINNYMSIIKRCSSSPTAPDCTMTCPSGWNCGLQPVSYQTFITADGMQWGDFATDKWCAVDTNGVKPPNQANKDVMVFCISSDAKIYPESHQQCKLGGANANFSPNALYWLSQ